MDFSKLAKNIYIRRLTRSFCTVATLFFVQFLVTPITLLSEPAFGPLTTSTDPDGDWDRDGLTNQEEADAGTHPLKQDTDSDGFRDKIDGWARAPRTSPPRLPEVRYAVARLNEIPFIQSRVSILNNAGEILMATTNPYIWSTEGVASLPGNIKEIVGFSDDGLVGGSAIDSEGNVQVATWRKGGAVQTKAANRFGNVPVQEEDEDRAWVWAYPAGITSNGIIYGGAGYKNEYVKKGMFSGGLNMWGIIERHEINARAFQWWRESSSTRSGKIGDDYRSEYHWYDPDKKGNWSATPGSGTDISYFRSQGFTVNNVGTFIASKSDWHSTTVDGAQVLVYDPYEWAIYDSNFVDLASLTPGYPNAIDISDGLSPFVIGLSYSEGSTRYPLTVWSKGQGWGQVLPNAYDPRYISGQPHEVNIHGEIAGYFWGDKIGHILRNQKLINLNDDGFSVSQYSFYSCDVINDNGMILSNAFDRGTSHMVSLMLIPIEVKTVNRDDPRRHWGDERTLAIGRPIFAGESCGDMVSFKASVPDSWRGLEWRWKAEGPDGEIVDGPSGAGRDEWKIADGDQDSSVDWLKWKPGKWKIKIQIGPTLTAEFIQEVGIRTEEYFVIGAIREVPNTIYPEVDSATLTNYSGPLFVKNFLFLNFNKTLPEGGVPEDWVDRFWVNLELINLTINLDYEEALDPAKPAEEAFGLDGVRHYRGFGRCQFKYLPKDGKLKQEPQRVGKLVQKIGKTPPPYQEGVNDTLAWAVTKVTPGVAHEKSGDVYGDGGDFDKNFDGDTRFQFLLEFMAGEKAAEGYRLLNRRHLPWVFFRFWFDMDDGLIKTNFDSPLGPDQDEDSADYTGVPSFYVYRRYFDLQTELYKVEKIRSIEMGDPNRYMNWMKTISGAIIGSPHYP